MSVAHAAIKCVTAPSSLVDLFDKSTSDLGFPFFIMKPVAVLV